MQNSIFREYDIRGKVSSEFKLDKTYDLTRAIATFFVQKNPHVKTIAVGMDGRLSSPVIKDEIIKALTDCGIDVLFIGVCPSPVNYFALYQLPVEAGLMITASHNPKEYNGIKISLGTHTIWGLQIQEIRQIYTAQNFLPLSLKKGMYTDFPLIDSYIAWLKEHFSSLIGSPLEMVIDCGNGAGGTVLPKLIEAMKWNNVHLLCAQVDGNYPNHEPDPTIEKNMQEVKAVLQNTSATIGIGLDGDCDRMAAMTKDGFLVPGDQLLAIFAREVLKNHPGSAVVFDIKASSGLIELLEQWGAQAFMAPCGHAIIKDRMHEENAFIGGELSCHFFFQDRHFGYDDGIYAMMRLFEILQKSGKSLSELISIFPKKYSSPEIRVECSEPTKKIIMEFLHNEFKNRPDVQLLTIDGIRVTWPYGWANVRLSHTQPVLSMRFEGNSKQDLIAIQEEFINLLSAYLDKEILIKNISRSEK